jgi:hypothetical protein
MSQVTSRAAEEVPISKLAPGDILLFLPNGTPGACAIELLTHSRYHHVALVDGRNTFVDAMPRGVRHTLLDSHPVIVVRPDVTPEARQRAVEWARKQVGKGYDGRGLLLIGLDRLLPFLHLELPRLDHFSCASFVAEAYAAAGVTLIPGRRWEDLVPGDFASLLGGEHRSDADARRWRRTTWPLAWRVFHRR